MRHDRLISRALEFAALSEQRFMLCALAVRGSKILSVGINRWRNTPSGDVGFITPIQHASIHAEMAALAQLKNVTGITMYVARLGRNGDSGMARPCQYCLPRLELRGVKEIVYTTGGPSLYAIERIR